MILDYHRRKKTPLKSFPRTFKGFTLLERNDFLCYHQSSNIFSIALMIKYDATFSPTTFKKSNNDSTIITSSLSPVSGVVTWIFYFAEKILSSLINLSEFIAVRKRKIFPQVRKII